MIQIEDNGTDNYVKFSIHLEGDLSTIPPKFHTLIEGGDGFDIDGSVYYGWDWTEQTVNWTALKLGHELFHWLHDNANDPKHNFTAHIDDEID